MEGKGDTTEIPATDGSKLQKATDGKKKPMAATNYKKEILNLHLEATH